MVDNNRSIVAGLTLSDNVLTQISHLGGKRCVFDPARAVGLSPNRCHFLSEPLYILGGFCGGKSIFKWCSSSF